MYEKQLLSVSELEVDSSKEEDRDEDFENDVVDVVIVGGRASLYADLALLFWLLLVVQELEMEFDRRFRMNHSSSLSHMSLAGLGRIIV